MNGQKTQDKNNRIDDFFNVWLDRMTEPSEAQKAVAPYLEDISEDFDKKLFGYISEVQEQAYYAGFAMAMQLAADCYAENKKIIRRT